MNELFAREFDSDEEDDEYVPDKKELEEDVIVETKKEVNMSKVDEIWNKLKSKQQAGTKESKVEDKEKHKSEKKESDPNLNQKLEVKGNISDTNLNDAKTSDDKPKSQEDDEIMKAINKMNELKNKTVTETVHFAGQKFEYQKTFTDIDLKKQKALEKKKTHAGLDNIIQMIEKKGNVNTYTKTKKDWDNYVEEKKIEKELDYNRKDGFLKKKQFIEATNMKIIENNKSTKRQKTDHSDINKY